MIYLPNIKLLNPYFFCFFLLRIHYEYLKQCLFLENFTSYFIIVRNDFSLYLHFVHLLSSVFLNPLELSLFKKWVPLCDRSWVKGSENEMNTKVNNCSCTTQLSNRYRFERFLGFILCNLTSIWKYYQPETSHQRFVIISLNFSNFREDLRHYKV